jgi:hypothetical protein
MAVPNYEFTANAKATDKLANAVNTVADDAANSANCVKGTAASFATSAADQIARARYRGLDQLNAFKRSVEREAAVDRKIWAPIPK